jgi:hypothetical protein
MIARRDTRNCGDATVAPALRIDPETPQHERPFGRRQRDW